MKPRLLAPFAAALCLTALLGGCTSSLVPTATGAQGLEQLLASMPETSGVEVVDGNNDAWSGAGQARGKVDLRNVSSARLKAVVNQIGGFLASERGSSVDWEAVSLSTDGIDLELTDRRDVDDELRKAFALVDPQSGFTYADLDRSVYVTSTGDDVVGVFDKFAATLSDFDEVGSQGLEVDSNDDAASFTIWVRDAQDRPDAAIDAYQALAGAFDVVAADITRYRVEVTVDPSKVAQATKAVDAMHLGDDLQIVVIGGYASDNSSS